MVHNLHVEDFFNRSLNCFDARVTKLKNFTRFRYDDVVVLFVLVRFFKLCRVFPELMLPHKAAGHQQVYGVVECCSTHPIILILHLDVQ